MCHPFLRDARFWLALLRIDQDIAREAREGRCLHCGGPLHSADYRRKPRGIETDALSIEFRYRLSFSCGREGCRKRLTPPSVRFLGRKVYLGAVVVLVTAMRQGPTPPGMRKLRDLFGADRRTISRWQKFWEEIFCRTKFWAVAKGHFVPPADERLLPKSVLDRAAGESPEEKLRAALRFLAPITTRGGLALRPS
jgi:hypothetical protein